MMKKYQRNSRKCPDCGQRISLSNIKRHVGSKACARYQKSLIGNVSRYKINQNKYKCPVCNQIFGKKGIATHIWSHTKKGEFHNKGAGYRFHKENGEAWNKGLTKDSDARMLQQSLTVKKRFKSGELTPIWLNRVLPESTKKKMSIAAKRRCKSLEGRKHMRKIGRNGGFGRRGTTKYGRKFDSLLESRCWNYLSVNNIPFIEHKTIPESAKVSDAYLVDENIWIEIDGINREKNKRWFGESYKRWKEKLELYEKLELELYIVYSYDEFKILIDKLCFSSKT